MDKVRSVNGVIIRLTKERWFHITEGHSEMAGYYYDILETIKEPDFVCPGDRGELFAVSQTKKSKYIVVVYKELSENDGFVITSFMTRKQTVIKRREQVWP